jgi:YD repeat-containing protein
MKSNLNPLFSAKAELEAIRKQRAELDAKAKALEEAIAILERVYHQMPSIDTTGLTAETGLTVRVFQVLEQNAGKEFTPTEIRDLLVTSGFSLEGRSNPMAEIHTTLKRLANNQGHIVAFHDDAGKTVYKYDPEMALAARERDEKRTAKVTVGKRKTVLRTGT